MGKAEVIETAKKMAESPDYYEALGYVLEVETECMGGDPDVEPGERETYSFDLAEASVTAAYGGRVIEVVRADDVVLFLEADHRGPEHGVDAWVGNDDASATENPVPQSVVRAIEATGVTDDA